jgi:hypothetical protein
LLLIMTLQGHAKENPSIAILEFEGNALSESQKTAFTNRLCSQLLQTDVFSVIERERI